MQKNDPTYGLLDRQASADYVGRSKRTLINWARKGKKKNVDFTIISKEAYYKISDLDEYLRSKQTF